MPIVFMLSKRAIAEAHPDADAVLSEEEARRGLGIDAIRGNWACAEPQSSLNFPSELVEFPRLHFLTLLFLLVLAFNDTGV
jgi:hypothetical protein